MNYILILGWFFIIMPATIMFVTLWRDKDFRPYAYLMLGFVSLLLGVYLINNALNF